MHQATLPLPCDNKSILGGLKSILGALYKPSDNAGRSQQLIRQQTSATAGHPSPAIDHHSTQLATGCHRPPQADQLATTGRSAGHHRPISWPPQAADIPKTQQNQAKIGVFLRENRSLLLTLCLPIEKSIIQLFYYCIYPVKLFRYTVLVVFWCFSHARRTPPSPKILHPYFFLANLAVFL
jgi:hypothetical protein